MNINLKGYSLKYHTYVFNVYNSSNYKKPILKKVNAPMLESAIDIINTPNIPECINTCLVNFLIFFLWSPAVIFILTNSFLRTINWSFSVR